MKTNCPHCQQENQGEKGDLIRCLGCQKVFEIPRYEVAKFTVNEVHCANCDELQDERRERCTACGKSVHKQTLANKLSDIPLLSKALKKVQAVKQAVAEELEAERQKEARYQLVKDENEAVNEQVLKVFGYLFYDNYSDTEQYNMDARRGAVSTILEEFPIQVSDELEQSILLETLLDLSLTQAAQIKQIAIDFEDKDFAWDAFDDCVKHLDAYATKNGNRYPRPYAFLAERPKPPTTLEQALPMLTVTAIRKVLREKGINHQGAREVLEKTVLSNCVLSDFVQAIGEKQKQLNKKYQTKFFKGKVAILLRTIKSRENAIKQVHLRGIEKSLEAYGKHFKLYPALRYYGDRHSPHFIGLLSDTDYSEIIKFDLVCKLPPLYPGDTIGIEYFKERYN